MLRYQTVPATPVQQNCSIVWCDPTMEAAVIDHAGSTAASAGELALPTTGTLEVRHCPGHVSFYSASAQRAFVGDVPFAGSMGRTYFPGGDHNTLVASITQRLWPMGDDTVFVPGHAPESTFGAERRHNPYVGGT